jgi:hypothetical protein
LYNTKRRFNVKLTESELTARRSEVVRSSIISTRSTLRSNESQTSSNSEQRSLRRPLSIASISTISSVSSLPLTAAAIEISLLESARAGFSPFLSSDELVISPRSLDPTHLLMIYTNNKPPRPSASSKSASSKKKKAKNNVVRVFPGVLEMPINSLLFALSTPNLANPEVFPHRRPSESDKLPRVLLQVKHIRTFHELVVFMHNGNQAELFRNIIPSWIHDQTCRIVLDALAEEEEQGFNLMLVPSLLSKYTLLRSLLQEFKL